MAYSDHGQVVSLKAAAALVANRLVYISAANSVNYVITSSSSPIGVTIDSANSSGSVPVVIGGIAKLECAVDCTVGSLVCMSTDGAGMIKPATLNATATSTNISIVGIALESGSVSSVIPVLLQIHSPFAR